MQVKMFDMWGNMQQTYIWEALVDTSGLWAKIQQVLEKNIKDEAQVHGNDCLEEAWSKHGGLFGSLWFTLLLSDRLSCKKLQGSTEV